MSSLNIQALRTEMCSWRRELHQHPEFGFEEKQTAAFIAAKLREFGLDDVAEGIGGTGIVGTLKKGTGTASIALRADMDALHITEQGNYPYKSKNDGIMHACGHDGHTSMLLGAAKWLATESTFNGTIYFIFQPAEEWGQGALAMLNDGLLKRFPFDAVYGIHNWPGLPVGHFATCAGPLMGAEDLFEITLTGLGGHASRPHTGREVLVAASSLVMDLQTIVSRRVNPADIAVVSVTEFITNGTRNALPGQVILKGDARSFLPEVSQTIQTEMRRLAAGTALAYDCHVEVNYSHEFIPLINDDLCTKAALQAAATVFESNNIDSSFKPVTVSEDFARFLKHVPGNFALIGNGEKSMPLHHPAYDFNDDALIYGAKYFIALAESVLIA
ncbi:M20 aminoacylase family protein [Mucilaginibacter ginsenosidivorax]|uniref:Amidohydrolase n=1 Tax=Mucilaginibacter ginsenosidivorax TaxID=862126 RepID=A0A5B8VWQ3_9SPHI|nr:M20 aminoacylase family protein [Mucilaginibacter ginsenosidivorax]QEC76134.1 amidohydrolase [Mucilaginibacter ginsenosidivorax]